MFRSLVDEQRKLAASDVARGEREARAHLRATRDHLSKELDFTVRHALFAGSAYEPIGAVQEEALKAAREFVSAFRETLVSLTREQAERGYGEALSFAANAHRVVAPTEPYRPPEEFRLGRADSVLLDVLPAQQVTMQRFATRLAAEIAIDGAKMRSATSEKPRSLLAVAGREGAFERLGYVLVRIVRTELLGARNKAAQRAIELLSTAWPDMKRVIVARFDGLTASDSVFVHGEIRGVDEPFTDGAGRTYMVPPARPNDREIIIPWRASWPRPDWMMPRPDEERRKARNDAYRDWVRA